MKKIIAIVLALMLLISLSTVVFAAADDWKFIASGNGKMEEVDGVIKVTGSTGEDVKGTVASANYKTPVDVSGFEFIVNAHQWEQGSWFAYGFSDKLEGGVGNTSVEGFGNGLMVICQFFDPTYMGMVFYSIDKNGFAVPTCTLGTITFGAIYPDQDTTIRIEADADYGYAIYVDDVRVVNDKNEDIDLTFLKEFFKDNKAYFGAATFYKGIEQSTFEIKSIKEGVSTPVSSAAASSTAVSSAASSSKATSSTAEKTGGCGNKAK